MTVLPSESDRGAKWLENFEVRDRPVAQLLLDSIRVTSATEMHAGLKRLLIEMVGSAPSGSCSLLPTGKPIKSEFISAADLLRSGSDLTVTEIAQRAASATAQATDLSVKQMLASKTKRLVIVTDFVGSGDQVTSLVDALFQSASIRSWHSGGQLRIEIASYSASLPSISRLRHDRRVDDFRWLEVAEDFETAAWSHEERQEVRDLCYKYAAKSKGALGWGDNGGLYTSGITFPNNTPLVFRQLTGRRGAPWFPLLPGSRDGGWDFDGEILLADYKPQRDFGEVLAVAEKLRFSRLSPRELGVLRRSGFGVSTLELLSVLAAIRKGHQTLEEVCTFSGLTSREASELLTRGRNLGLIDLSDRLTPAGRGFLKYPTRKRRLVSQFADPDAQMYYPQQLR